jgi:hypothetical protein
MEKNKWIYFNGNEEELAKLIVKIINMEVKKNERKKRNE